MTSTIDRQKAGKSVVTVTLTPEQASNAEAQSLRALSAGINVKGFRPGKAPESVLRNKIPTDRLLEETIRIALRSVLPALLHEHGLSPILPPRIEAVSQHPLMLKITFIERPTATIKHPQKLAPPKKGPATDPTAIERVIQSALAEHRSYAVVERAAAKGDRVTARFSATDAQGKDIPGLRVENERIILGESRLLPGFEDELIGLTAGNSKTFTLTLPEKFPMEALRNTPATFTTHIDSVESVTTPTLDDAFASTHLQHPTAQAFRETVEKSIREQEERFERMSREKSLLDAIRDQTQADLPDELIESELQTLVEDWAGRLEQQGRSVEDALKQQGKTAKQVEEELRAEAVNRWKLRLGIAHLIDERTIVLSAEELQRAIDAFLDNLRDEDRADAERRITAKDALYEEVRWRATVDKLIDGLLA